MSKLFKKVALGTLCAVLLACIVTVGVIFGISGNGKNKNGGINADGGHNGASLTAGNNIPTASLEKFDKEYILKDTLTQTKAQIWDEAVDTTKNAGKKIKVTLGEDWTAITTGIVFDTAAVTGPSNLLGSPAGNLIVPVGIDMVLDLAGHTIDRGLSATPVPTNSAHGSAMYVYGTLEITGNGTIKRGCTLGNGGGINIQPSGKVTLKGVTISDNYAWCGGGILVKGSLTIYDAVIQNNHAVNNDSSTASGGGIFLYAGGTCKMYGGEIKNNEAIYQGGGVALRAKETLASDTTVPKFTMYGGKITNNTCTYGASAVAGGGGGVAVTYGATFTMEDGAIDYNRNSVNGSGAGVKVEYSGTFEMKSGSVSNNQCSGGPGGGILAENGGNVTIRNGNIISNAAGTGCGGGGIFMRNGANKLIFDDGFVKGNTCDGTGGGICVMGTTTATFNGGVITGNTCGASGFGDGIGTGTGITFNLGGPLVCCGNGTRDVRLDSGVKINVTGELHQNGKSAWIGMAAYDATNGYAFTSGFGPTSRNTDYYASQFFFANGGGLAINSLYTAGPNKEAKFETNTLRDWRTVTWSYEVGGVWTNVPAGTQNLRLPYGTEITNVKAEYTNADSSVLTMSTANTSDNATTKQFRFFHAEGKTLSGTTVNLRATGNTVKEAGNYVFDMDIENTALIGCMTGFSTNTFISNPTLNIQIEKAPVTVTVGAQQSVYGIKYDIAKNCTTSLAGVTATDLGVTVEKGYGTDVGKYSVCGTGWTNKNYNVTFVNGTLEIKPRAVTVIINNASAIYGEVYGYQDTVPTTVNKYETPFKASDTVAMKQTENKTPVIGVAPYTVDPSDSTKYYDANNKLVDNTTGYLLDPTTGNPIYNGGWRYNDVSQADDEEQFLPADCTAADMPFLLMCTSVDGLATSTNKNYLAKGTYVITHDTNSVNKNYTITFVKDDGSDTGDTSGSTSTLTIEGAQFSVLSASDYSSKVGGTTPAYDSYDYDGMPHQASLPVTSFTGTDSKEYPAGAIIVTGNTEATDLNLLYLIYKEGETGTPKKDDADDKAILDDDSTKWASGTNVSTDLEKDEAGTYIVYTRIESPNYVTKIHKWTFTIGAQTTPFKLNAYWGTGTTTRIATTDSTVTIPATDKDKAVYDGTTTVHVDITFVDSTGAVSTTVTSTNCKTIVFYKNTALKVSSDPKSWKWGAWDTTFTRLETTDTTSALYKFSDDLKHHEDYGTTEKPKNGGTYTATVVEDPTASNGYNLATGGRSVTFTIKPKVVNVPTNTDNFTYNGQDQKFSISGFDKATMEIVGDPTMDGTTPTGLSYDTPNNFLATESGTSYKMVAKNAGEYTLTFGFKADEKDNYKWETEKVDPSDSTKKVKIEGFNSDETEYGLKLTIKKAQLKATFTSPQKSIDSTKADKWTWEFEAYKGSKDKTSGDPNALIKFVVDTTSIITVGTLPEAVTYELHWAAKPATSGTALSDMNTGVIADPDTSNTEDVLNVDNAAFAKGTYYVYLTLPASNPVNKNYQTLVVDDTTKLPKINASGVGDCVRRFVVDDGNASVSDIVWLWTDDNGTSWNSYVVDSPNPTTDPDTELTYALDATTKTAVEYSLEMDTDTGNGYPAYYEVPAASDYSTTYCKTETGTYAAATGTSNAGFYKTTVKLKIKSGQTIKFVAANDTDNFKRVDDSNATYTFCWKISKAKINPADVVELGYVVRDKKTSTLSDFAKFASVKEGTDTVYEVGVQDGGNGIIVAVNLPTNLTVAPYDVSAILKAGTITGKGTSVTPETKQTTGALLETKIPFSILTTAADNYEFAKDDAGNSLSTITIKWRVVAATVDAGDIVWSDPDPDDPTNYVDDEGNGTTLTGEVDEIGKDGKKTGKKITVTLPTPKVKAGDDKVKYIYEWDSDGDGIPDKTVEGLQGLYELVMLSDREYGGGILPGTVTVKIEPKDGYRLDPSVPSAAKETSVVIGDTKTRVQMSADGGVVSGTYKEIVLSFTVEELDASGNASAYDTDMYTLWIYKNGDESDKVAFSTAELQKLNSGKHTVAIELVNTVSYKLVPGSDKIEIEVKAIELDLPTFTCPVFNGINIDVTVGDYIDEVTRGYLTANIVSVSGDTSVRDANRTYLLNFTIVDTVNYIWKAENSTVTAKYTLLADEATTLTAKKDSDSLAKLDWEVQPLVITKDMMTWKGLNSKNGAQLVLNLNENIVYTVDYKYYSDLEGGSEVTETKAGDRVYVAAILGGDDADSGNIVFDGAVAGTNGLMLAERQPHTIPKSGFASVAGSALNFVKTNWLWFVIALAILIFLIILICIIRHRKKTKEERLAKKEAEKEKKEEEKRKKEEEKQRKEEERIRKEEEREAAKQKQQAELEAQKAKQQAELELAKAKQEAELAKIKAQAGMAGAGVAAMAMAQQPQQQQMPQQMPQQQMQQPQQQMQMPQQMPQYSPNADAGVLARIESELADIKAQQRAMSYGGGYPQMPAYPPQAYGPQPSGGNDAVMMAKMDAEFTKMQAKQDAAQQVSAAKMELEFMKMHGYAPQNALQPASVNAPAPAHSGGVITAEQLGTIMAAMMRGMNVQHAPKEVKQIVEEATPTVADTPITYPADAVITTTTTVDTTKNKAPARSREDELRALDIDGFYDTFEENK
ncbi:MAG: hypothetical protein NC489_28900 [Ruminococcus flavefaciens]|nr:hypothetical protein [Ruminococcus flavefaciens]